MTLVVGSISPASSAVVPLRCCCFCSQLSFWRKHQMCAKLKYSMQVHLSCGTAEGPSTGTPEPRPASRPCGPPSYSANTAANVGAPWPGIGLDWCRSWSQYLVEMINVTYLTKKKALNVNITTNVPSQVRSWLNININVNYIATKFCRPGKWASIKSYHNCVEGIFPIHGPQSDTITFWSINLLYFVCMKD